MSAINLEDIQSFTEFQRNAKNQIRRLKRSGRPQVLTVKGRAEIVVQDAKSYQNLLDVLDQAQAVAAVREGLESMTLGKGRPAKAVFERLRRKHRIPIFR